MQKTKSVFLLVGIGLFIVGCGRGEHTRSSGLLFGRLDSYCKPNAQGEYSGTAVQIAGKGNNGKHDYGFGGGCILKSLDQVWKTSQTAAALTWDRTELTGLKSVTPVPTGVALLLRAEYEAGFAPFIQKFTKDWTHRTESNRVSIGYEKIKGTSHISYWKGTIELESLADNVTAMSMYNEVSASQTGPNEAADSVRDMLNRLRK